MPENNFEEGVFYCENASRGSNYFPEKKNLKKSFHYFSFNMHEKPNQNGIIYI